MGTVNTFKFPAVKLGMTEVFSDDGTCTPVSILRLIPIKLGALSEHGGKVYASWETDEKIPVRGSLQFKDAGEHKAFQALLGDREKLRELRYFDVTGISKGKGFQGSIKRFHFHGGPGGHGSKFHRDLGGTSQGTNPARNYKGTKMAGHMGFVQRTVQNLLFVDLDSEQGFLFLRGAVPGPKSTHVYFRPAKKLSLSLREVLES